MNEFFFLFVILQLGNVLSSWLNFQRDSTVYTPTFQMFHIEHCFNPLLHYIWEMFKKH